MTFINILQKHDINLAIFLFIKLSLILIINIINNIIGIFYREETLITKFLLPYSIFTIRKYCIRENF